MNKKTKKLIKKVKKKQKNKTMEEMENYYITSANIVRSKAVHHLDISQYRQGYLDGLNDFATYSTGSGFND